MLWPRKESAGVADAMIKANHHVVKRLRQWLCHKHKVRGSRGTARFPDAYLHQALGLVHLETQLRNRPWANA